MLMRLLGDPPAVREARKIRWEQYMKDKHAVEHQKLERVADRIFLEQEENARTHGPRHGHLKDATGPTKEATGGWAKIRVEKQEK